MRRGITNIPLRNFLVFLSDILIIVGAVCIVILGVPILTYVGEFILRKP